MFLQQDALGLKLDSKMLLLGRFNKTEVAVTFNI